MHARAWIRSLFSLGLLLLVPNCFDSSSGNGSSGTDSGGGCPEGSAGCDCYGNGTCDSGLECSADNKCLSPDCTAGAEDCPCADGLCLGDLVCDGGICKPGSGGTSTSGGSTSASGTSTSSTTDATATDATSGPGTDSGPGTSGPGSTGGNACMLDGSEDDCGVCVKESCCEQLTTCVDDSTCSCILDCIDQGGDPMSCGPNCGPPTSAFPDLQDCMLSGCMELCDLNLPPECRPMQGVQECTACIQTQCCSEWMACQQIDDCVCLEQCMSQANIPMNQCMADCGIASEGDIPEEYWNITTCSESVQCMDTGLNVPCYPPP